MPPEETVALVDPGGAVVGSAPRSRLRRENLLHAATAVVVRDPGGRVYVHRRSPDKDWWPSAHDAASGGVLLAGEEPGPAALREIGEELGITGVTLRPLLSAHYEDATVRCFTHCFETTYDGVVTHADGEVVWGEWVTLAELGDRLRDPAWTFVPDTRALLRRLSEAGFADYGMLGEVPGGGA
jgi:8-oxo-dGTP pyrophosphatase MutT (NUDIX family)